MRTCATFPAPFFGAVRFEWSKVWGERVGEWNRLVANAIEYRPILPVEEEQKYTRIFSGEIALPSFIRELFLLR